MAGLPLLSTSEGILRCRAALYHRKRSAVVAGGGGQMSITHRWPRSASNQSHTHLSHVASPKTTGTEGKHKSILVPTCLGPKRTNVLLSFFDLMEFREVRGKLHFI